jgi:hypothetical protein
MKKIYSASMIVIMLFVFLGSPIFIGTARAASLYVNSSANGIFATTSTAQDFTLSYATALSLNYASSSVITVRLKDDTGSIVTLAHLLPCTVPTTQIFGTNITFGTSSTATGTATFTLNAATSTGSVATGTMCVRIPATSIQVRGIYTVSMTAGNYDTGLALLYVGADPTNLSGNEVSISAQIEPILSVKLSAYSCAIGALDIYSIKSCNYTLVYTTNVTGATPITTKIYANQNFQNSGGAAITPVAGGTSVATGTARYGISVATSSASTTIAAGFNTLDNPIPVGIGAATAFLTISSPVQGATTTITHKAAIDANTPIGTYSQNVFYITTVSY